MLERNQKEIEQIFRNNREIALLYKNGAIIYDKRHKEPVFVTVQDLIDQGYATVATGSGGNGIQILNTCPYEFDHITDLEEVALNKKQLTEGTNNIVLWNQPLPTGWNESDVVALYDEELSFSLRGGLFWALSSSTESISLSFAGSDWAAVDYPWGSYESNGIFAHRYNYPGTGTPWETPKNITITIRGNYGSVAQVAFNYMSTTENFTLNCGGIFACHDVTGMFEGCGALKNLIITGSFRWDNIRTCHNVFDGCNSLTSIPYVTAWGRDSEYNTIYPRYDEYGRGSADCRHLFNATSLESIGPRLNMNAVSLEGCTIDGRTQQALSAALFNCPELTDVRIINLNNSDWDFTDAEGYVYIPKMDVTSAEYLLNNVADVTEQGGHTVTLPANGTISTTAITNAETKGWTVNTVNR